MRWCILNMSHLIRKKSDEWTSSKLFLGGFSTTLAESCLLPLVMEGGNTFNNPRHSARNYTKRISTCRMCGLMMMIGDKGNSDKDWKGVSLKDKKYFHYEGELFQTTTAGNRKKCGSLWWACADNSCFQYGFLHLSFFRVRPFYSNIASGVGRNQLHDLL